MRLLNTRTLTLTAFIGEAPDYVILSHRWEEEELIFEDVMKSPISDTSSPARAKRGFSKVQGTCALALKDGFDWVWIDSCCIDKSSSAELQEAINSMFRWYQEAQICYAYLSDIPDREAGFDAFKQSLWFTRGWTLQELLAPSSVEFYATDWTSIGSKASRAAEIAHITGIDLAALQNDWHDLKDKYFAAEKISWSSHRLVTRTEDIAYCLLGLFDANMPLLYGEGGLKAFRRLQQVVFESEADHTLFLFRNSEHAITPLLANSVRQFCQRDRCKDCASQVTCLPGHITYSQMRTTLDTRWPAFDEHYLKLVKGGVKLKVHRLPYTSSLKLQSLRSGDYAPRVGPDKLVALLPVTLVGYERHVMGILLTRLPTSEYIRHNGVPFLVDMKRFRGIEMEPQTLMVSDKSTRPAHVTHDFARFEFHSTSFTLSSWSCTTNSYEHPKGSGTIITVSKTTSDRFALTIRTSSTSSGLSPIIVLGNSIKELQLQSVEMQGDGSTSRLESRLDSFTNRMNIPLISRQGCIKIALRRLCTTYTDDILVGKVGARYRVDVEYVGNSHQY